MNKKLIFIGFIILFLGCEYDVKVLGKASKVYEFPLKAVSLAHSKTPNPYMFYSEPIYFKNDYFYLSSNAEDKRIIKINRLGHQVLSIGSRDSLLKVNLVGKVNTVPIKAGFSKFNFNHILRFTVDENENIYVINLFLPKEKKEDNKKDKIKGLNKNDPKVKDTDNTRIDLYSPYSRTIIKFDKNGKYLYTIGKQGIKTDPFTKNNIIKKFYSDKHNNLYLILKDDISNAPNKRFADSSYHLYRFNSSGERSLYKRNINQYIPKEKNYISIIENIEITPFSEKLLIMVRYYKKQISRLGVKYDYDFKKLYLFNINDLKAYELRRLDDKEKRYLLLGVAQKDSIYLMPPFTGQKEKGNNFIYQFKVLNNSGSSIEGRSLKLKGQLINNYNWFTLTNDEKIIVFSQLDDNMQVHIYN